MPEISKWLDLYNSANLEVKYRASVELVERGDETPLPTLLDILDNLEIPKEHKLPIKYPREGIEKALLKRNEPELLDAMVERLSHPSMHVRSIACEVLGHLRDHRATTHLVHALGDSEWWVRRQAAFALGSLKDPKSISALKRCYSMEEDNNVLWGLKSALKSLGVDYADLPKKKPWWNI